MRRLVKKTVEYVHTVLILALILPALYSLGAEQPDLIGSGLYAKSLIIVLPIIATDFAVKQCKGLLSYLIVSAMIFAATSALGWTVAASLRQSPIFWVYIIVIMAETIFLIFNRMVERLHRKQDQEASKGEDPSWRPYFEGLRSPSFYVLIYFGVIYMIAVNLNNPAVCNAALFSAAVYTLITLLYQYICETETYLSLNKRTCNIPSKRIYGIGTGMLAIFLLLFIIVMLPALFTISNRHYRDLRQSLARIEFDYTELLSENDMIYPGKDPMESFFGEYGEQKPTPAWLITLSYVIEVVTIILLVTVLIKFIYNTFHAFREAADENGDIVEELEETPKEAVNIKKAPVSRRKLSERERIRREYRRYIRRYRKDQPACYESPIEIERNAGIAESEEGKEHHRKYELARYGFFRE